MLGVVAIMTAAKVLALGQDKQEAKHAESGHNPNFQVRALNPTALQGLGFRVFRLSNSRPVYDLCVVDALSPSLWAYSVGAPSCSCLRGHTPLTSTGATHTTMKETTWHSDTLNPTPYPQDLNPEPKPRT